MSLNSMKIAVIVPAFNESKLISETLASIPDFVDRIFAIDDASMDSTYEEIIKAQSLDARVVPLKNEINLGVGGSITKGYKEALKKGMDICVVMDGDGQMPPEYLRELIVPITENRADVAKGNRFFSKNSFKSMPPHRILGNAVFSILNKIGSGYWKILDPQNGYIASRSTVIEKIDFEKLTNGYAFQNAYLCAIKMQNVYLVDVPIPAKYGNEISTMPIFKVTFVIIGTLGRNFFKRIISFSLSPIALAVQAAYFSSLSLLGLFAFHLRDSSVPAIKLVFASVIIFGIATLIESKFEKHLKYR